MHRFVTGRGIVIGNIFNIINNRSLRCILYSAVKYETAHLKTVVFIVHLLKIAIYFYSFSAWSRFMDGITEIMKNDPDLPIFNVSYEEMIMVSNVVL